MMFVRGAHIDDLDDLYELTRQASQGITSLPPDKDFLKTKIYRSQESFARKVASPENELYFFVLEDTATKKVIGCSAIEAKIGTTIPFYSYKCITTSEFDAEENIHVENTILMLTCDFNGASELCSLYLHHDFRKKNHGLLLSLSRFMWMMLEPQRFATTVISEIRGVNKEGFSPFWDSLGKHFFKMDFPRADRLSGHGSSIVNHLVPKLPIYTSLLSPEARKVIGIPHLQAQKAYHILLNLGFEYNGYVDIFDAGPTVSATMENIKIIQNCFTTHIRAIQSVRKIKCLLGTRDPQPRFVIDKIEIIDHEIIISEETAQQLGKKAGDEICVYLLENQQ